MQPKIIEIRGVFFESFKAEELNKLKEIKLFKIMSHSHIKEH